MFFENLPPLGYSEMLCGMIGREQEIKTYYKTLMHRQETLVKAVSRKMVVHNTLITTNGLVKNEYSGIFTNVITLDDLFSS